LASLTVNAVVLKQKHTSLYLFSMASDELNEICYVTPRSHDDPKEIQRILSRPRARAIGKYIEEPNTLLPTAIVVSLEPEVAISETGTSRLVTITFPDQAGKFAYVLDGQHRLGGFKESTIQFDLPVIALHGADEQTRAKVFADINSKQVPITDVQILELYYQIKDLAPEDDVLVSIVHALNEMVDSPLRDHVKILPQDKKKWVKNTILKRFLVRAVKPSGISIKPPGQQATILKEYLKAVTKLWPDAWDQPGYSLSSSAGLEITLGVFPAVKHRVDLNNQKNYSAESFVEQMQPLKDATISLKLLDGSVGTWTLDWQTDAISALSNSQKGRNFLIDALNGVLHAADEEDATPTYAEGT
jgi:DGQHR domain-containing protein